MAHPSSKQAQSGSNQNNAPHSRGNNRGGGGGGGNAQKCPTCDNPGHMKHNCPWGDSGGDRNTGSSAASSTVPRDSKSTSDKEDLLLKKFSTLKRTATRYPFRPSYGKNGEVVELQANYFPLQLPDTLVLYRYNLTIEARIQNEKKPPSELKGKKLKQIISLRLSILKERLASCRLKCYIATDYKSNLVCSTKIQQDLWDAEITYLHENDPAAGDNSPKYLVCIRENAPHLEASQLKNFLASPGSHAQYDKEPMLQALNILFGHHAKSTSTTTMVGGNRAYTSDRDTEKRPLDAYVEAVRGYFLSVRLCSFSSMVNVNVSHSAFYKGMPLIQFIEKLPAKADDPKYLDYSKLETLLRGVHVETKHLKDRSKTQITKVFPIKAFATTIDGGDQSRRPLVEENAAQPSEVWFHLDDVSKFEERERLKKKGTGYANYINVRDYFKIKYEILSNQYGRYPVINYGSTKDPRYVLAEACTVVPGQLAKLTSDQMEAMSRFAVRKPSENKDSITTSGLRALGLKPLAEGMTNLGITVVSKMAQVSGRLLDAPQILYKNDKAAKEAPGGWNLVGSKFKMVIPEAKDQRLGRWGSLRLKSKYSTGNHESAISRFQKSLSICGMNLNTPDSETLDSSKSDLLEKTIAALHKRNNLDILLITLPFKNIALYNRIKRHSDQNEGIHTVCVIEDKFLKCQGAYFGNVALKFNLKLGGTNHTLSDTDMGIVSQGKTMVVGIDVVHPSPGSGRASIAAMVGSIDKNLAQWPVDLRVQIREGKEMLDKIRGMISSRLALWKKQHVTYPENILVYRDGVSEGQYEQVLDEELEEMRKESKELYTTTHQAQPRFTLIIVAKRHHTRFFPPEDHPMIERTGNFRRGLLVDRGITELRTWDFFLQSHDALQGTARPGHYVVLWDEIFTNPQLQSVHQKVQPNLSSTDRLHQLTNSMCYLFSRATKAVRIPAPVYYADIACERASRYLAGDVNDGESVVTDRTELTQGERERRRVELQRRIEVHAGLRDSMFYV